MAEQKSSSGRVLERAVGAVGIERLAATLEVSAACLQPFVRGARVMTLPQQHALAVAVLTLSADHPVLRRDGAALLGQVRAAEDFAVGTTERHMYGPSWTRWPRA